MLVEGEHGVEDYPEELGVDGCAIGSDVECRANFFVPRGEEGCRRLTGREGE